jgi:hypothetical protein
MANHSPRGGEQSLRLRWTLAVRDDPRVPSFDKHLALTLSTFMDEGGYCWPGVSRIAEAMGVDPRSVQRHLHGDLRTKTEPWLRDLGYLRIERGGGQSRARPGGARSRTHGFLATLPQLGETQAECHPYPGALTPKGGTVTDDPGKLPPELSRELVTELVTTDSRATAANAAPHSAAETALIQLVEALDCADPKTLATLRGHFRDLGADDFRYALHEVEKRKRDRPLGERLVGSDAAYAFAILSNIVHGYSGATPA